MAQGLLLPVGMVILTAPFWVSAILKARDFNGFVDEVAGFDIPAPRLVALAVIAVQALGSGLILTGLWPECGPAMLIAFTLAASVHVHGFWRFSGAERAPHLNAFLANLGLCGGLLIAVTL